MKIKMENVKAASLISDQINNLKNTNDIIIIKEIFKEIEKILEEIFENYYILDDFNKEVLFQENEFSAVATKNNILAAKDKVVLFLEKLSRDLIKHNKFDEVISSDFSEEIAILIISRILENFYIHIDEMYSAEVHGRSTIEKANLDNIKIGNEFDVQRMLYSIIKPILPEARLEVYNDTGYGSVRYDIIIEKFNIIIEVKCSRKSMTERTLTEEIGSDSYHYKYKNIFFFVYDKDKIIKNKQVFENAYTRVFQDDKFIRTFVNQPIMLL